MKEIKVEFEKYDGTINAFIQSAKDGEKYLLQMVNIKDKNKGIEVKFCEIHKIMNGNMGIINGHFSADYDNFMKIIGICKLII